MYLSSLSLSASFCLVGFFFVVGFFIVVGFIVVGFLFSASSLVLLGVGVLLYAVYGGSMDP
jgi:hypothetical protein